MLTNQMKIVLLSAVVLFSSTALHPNGAPAPTGPEYTRDAQLKFPEHYREWVYLTTGFDMSYNPAMQMGHHMFDNVFVNPVVWELTSHDWPPLKSMPRLSPRVPSEMTPSRMTKAEAANHHRRLPMKSNDVSPR